MTTHPTSAQGMPAQVAPPQFELSDLPVSAVAAQVLAVPVLPGPDGAPILGPGAAELADLLGTGLLGADLLALADLDGNAGVPGQVTCVPVPAGLPDNEQVRWVLLVGLGDESPAAFRRAGAAMARSARDRARATSVATSLVSLASDALQVKAFVAGAVLGSFGFHWSEAEPERVPVGHIVLTGLPGSWSTVLERAQAVAEASWQARLLATVPSHLKSPAWLAAQAERLGRAAGLTVTVWDEKRLAAEGFGGLLGVGQASATPPRFIRMDYQPRSGRKPGTVVLVGKGITFDSGGLSIKPGDSMVTMKRDMTGGAVVISVLAALQAVGCPVRVVGLVPTAENAISGQALRPGDVLRHYGGRTSEVTDTDAEGRLVLGDALAYAVDQLKPDVIVDVATLTGAMKVALGQRTGGFFANHEALAAAIQDAGQASGETLWRMPLAEVYQEKLRSKVADADNAAGGPGAITAALFLQHFVGDVPWAHLDVASVGDSPDERHEWTTGPTGFGARALLHWLGSTHPLEGMR